MRQKTQEQTMKRPSSLPNEVIATVKFRFEGQERIAGRLFHTHMPISALLSFVQTQCGHYAGTHVMQIVEYTGDSKPVGSSGAITLEDRDTKD